jgi:hypothetical protein
MLTTFVVKVATQRELWVCTLGLPGNGGLYVELVGQIAVSPQGC